MRESALLPDRVTAEVAYPTGSTVNISFVPESYNIDLLAAFRNEKDPVAQIKAIAQLLVESKLEWDLEDDNGDPIVPTFENLCRRRLTVLTPIVEAVTASAVPKAST